MRPISVPDSRTVSSASSRAKFIDVITTYRASILDRVYDTVRSLFTSYGDAIDVDGGVRPGKDQLSTWTSNAFKAVRIPADLRPKCSPHVRLAATFTPVQPTDHGIGKMRHTIWNLGKDAPKFARETGNKRAAAIASANAENLKKLDALMTLYERATDSQTTFIQLESSISDSFSFLHPGIGNWNASGMTNDDAARTLTGALEIYKKDVDDDCQVLTAGYPGSGGQISRRSRRGTASAVVDTTTTTTASTEPRYYTQSASDDSFSCQCCRRLGGFEKQRSN